MTIPAVEKQPCYPLREGNIAIPYIDGVNAMSHIFEAMSNAQSKVWLTMCFVDIDCIIPSINKSIISIITEISKNKNIDVRILAWRSKVKSGDFAGTISDFKKLKKIDCKAKFRWDSNQFGCHHQKIFIIDENIAFVGGINMDETHIDDNLHIRRTPHSTHDLFCKIKGPAVKDVMHNFVQRWNEATDRNMKYGAYPQDVKPDDLTYPSEKLLENGEGDINVQVIRTIPENVYPSIDKGEFSIRQSYFNAINNAQKYIYLENQYFFDKVSHYSVIRALIYAAYRGVKVFVIIPGNPDFTKLFSFEFLREVKNHPNIYVYTLATPYEIKKKNYSIYDYNDIYIHAKLFIVDDEWYSIGSANISYQSLRTDSEMNVAVWDPEGAKKLRYDLWKEHLEYSDNHTKQYSREIILDDIDAAFEQLFIISQANSYYRKTMAKAESRLMLLDIKKYTILGKIYGSFKDFFVRKKMKLSGYLGDAIRYIREFF